MTKGSEDKAENQNTDNVQTNMYDFLKHTNSVEVFGSIKTLIVDVVTNLNKGKAEQMKEINRSRFKSQLIYGIVVAFFVCAIGTLGYCQVLEKNITGTLLSMVIGYAIGNASKKTT